jgi:hypothetical protein
VASGWRSLQTPAEVRDELLSEVGEAADKPAVERWLQREAILFSDYGDRLRFTLKGPAKDEWVGVTWVVAMRFSAERLDGIDVDEALTGP